MPPVHNFKYPFVFIKCKYLITHMFLEGSSILPSSHWLTEYKVQGPVTRSHLNIKGDAKIIVDFTNVTILNLTVTLKWLTTLKQIVHDRIQWWLLSSPLRKHSTFGQHKIALELRRLLTTLLTTYITNVSYFANNLLRFFVWSWPFYITTIMEWWHHCFCISESNVCCEIETILWASSAISKSNGITDLTERLYMRYEIKCKTKKNTILSEQF